MSPNKSTMAEPLLKRLTDQFFGTTTGSQFEKILKDPQFFIPIGDFCERYGLGLNGVEIEIGEGDYHNILVSFNGAGIDSNYWNLRDISEYLHTHNGF